MSQKLALALSALLLSTTIVEAQIRVNAEKSPEELVKQVLAGDGVQIGEITWVGDEDAVGEFYAKGTNLPIEHGIVLSTGQATGVEGPNTGTGTTTGHFGALVESDNRDIKKYLNNPAYDLSMLEFDFVPVHNKLQFQYVFGSEEYPEYVGAEYNDIFVFILQEPSGKKSNLALVPGTDMPVSVNSINEDMNRELFKDNNPKRGKDGQKKKKQSGKLSKFAQGGQLTLKDEGIGPDSLLMASLEFDGLTRTLTAEAYVRPYMTYRLKLIIADVGDNIYDSGIFFAANSMSAVRDPEQPGFTEYMTPDQIAAYDEQMAAAKVEEVQDEPIAENIAKPIEQEEVESDDLAVEPEAEQVVEMPTPEPRAEIVLPESTLDAEMEASTALTNVSNKEEVVESNVDEVESHVDEPDEDFIDEEEGGGGTAFVYGASSAESEIRPESPFLSGREVEFSVIVHFEFDSYGLVPKAIENLDGLAEGIKMLDQPMCIVLGHTDSKGNEDYNSELALKRSKAVQQYLEKIGATEDPCWVKQYGEYDPMADNDTEEGRYGNRRVKVVFKGIMPAR